MGGKGRTWRRRRKKNDSCKKAISLAAEPEYVALFRWAKKNGVVFNHMKPALFPGIGRGLMATSRINTGDLLISVPRRLLVTENMIRHAYVPGLESDINTVDLLCMFLIIERSFGRKSFWFPYIAMLPLDFNTPSYFSAKELGIVPKFFQDHYHSQMYDIKKCMKSVKHLMNYVPDNMTKNIEVNFENVRWAWNVVNTRSVYMGSGSISATREATKSFALAPLLDLLNHSCDIEVQAGFSEVPQCYGISTKTTFAKGHQVFINYGPHGNRRLLAEYGFILPDNCHSSMPVKSPLVYEIVCCSHGDISEKKFNVIAKYNLEETYSCTAKGLSWSLTTALKILVLDDARLTAKSINIEDLHLTENEKQLIKLFSRCILNHLLEDCQSNCLRIELKCQSERSSQDCRISLIYKLLNQEKAQIQNALSNV